MTPTYRFRQSYTHDHRIAVIVEFALASEFTARTEAFSKLALDVAMQITATDPASVALLLQQAWLKDPLNTVEAKIAECATRLQEQIEITRFVRWG